MIADSEPEHAAFLGNATTEYGAALLSRVFRGETVLWLPSAGGFITSDFELRGAVQKPGVAFICPIAASGMRPHAAMLITSGRVQQKLDGLLHTSEEDAGNSVYAITKDGYLLTLPSWFDLLSEQNFGAQRGASRDVRVTDPGGSLVDGHQPTGHRNDWQLTEAAAGIASGLDGMRIQGYRDPRGVEVAGAWRWLPDYRIGIVTERDLQAAMKPLDILRKGIGAFAAILLTALLFILCRSGVVRLRRPSGIGRVGPYTLRTLLGEGGFAHVYLASHALLKRPTAVKVLKEDQVNRRNLDRFEREVQLASSLTHPNTIGIYDYGASADGRFYYAMEYISGLTLQELIGINGPLVPERTTWILIQICRSLREAHRLSLIHRDIKPQNIMLCRRGGEYDAVKVLDFGLARNLDNSESDRVTQTQLLIGTPMYIAPERILDPGCMDPRSDIYALGILGYFLLTGREPFTAACSVDALAQAIHRQARRPSEGCRFSIPEQLDRLIRDCHARIVSDRPTSIESVLSQLEEISFSSPWNSVRAETWWRQHRAAWDSLAQDRTSGTSRQKPDPLPRVPKSRA